MLLSSSDPVVLRLSVRGRGSFLQFSFSYLLIDFSLSGVIPGSTSPYPSHMLVRAGYGVGFIIRVRLRAQMDRIYYPDLAIRFRGWCWSLWSLITLTCRIEDPSSFFLCRSSSWLMAWLSLTD